MPDLLQPSVTTVADARAGLSGILRSFRADPSATPVTIGSHRRPEAVLVPVQQFRALAEQRPAGPLLHQLQARASLIAKIASLNRVSDVAVFGSIARGADGPESDIDLLVTPMEGMSLFDLAQFELDMSELTGRQVQVVSRRALDPRSDESILAGAVSL